MHLPAEEFRKLSNRHQVLQKIRGKLHGWSLEPELELTDGLLANLDITRRKLPTFCARLEELVVHPLTLGISLPKEAVDLIKQYTVTYEDAGKIFYARTPPAPS
jgi:hypothetical protein